jgi:RNA polymerase sigma-70 factor (ECF subfamily)
MERTDSDIVSAYRQGDASAFDLLTMRYMRRVYTFTYRLTNDAHGAEDAVSETFIKVWKNLDSFDETKSFASWLFRIARNATFDILRKKKDVAFSRLMTDEDDTDIGDTLPDDRDLPDIDFDRALSNEILEKSLAQLSLDKRTIVLLHDIDGLTFEEIAEVVGKPMNTVKSQYRRALISLKEMVAPKQ